MTYGIKLKSVVYHGALYCNQLLVEKKMSIVTKQIACLNLWSGRKGVHTTFRATVTRSFQQTSTCSKRRCSSVSRSLRMSGLIYDDIPMPSPWTHIRMIEFQPPLEVELPCTSAVVPSFSIPIHCRLVNDNVELGSSGRLYGYRLRTSVHKNSSSSHPAWGARHTWAGTIPERQGGPFLGA